MRNVCSLPLIASRTLLSRNSQQTESAVSWVSRHRCTKLLCAIAHHGALIRRGNMVFSVVASQLAVIFVQTYR